MAGARGFPGGSRSFEARVGTRTLVPGRDGWSSPQAPRRRSSCLEFLATPERGPSQRTFRQSPEKPQQSRGKPNRSKSLPQIATFQWLTPESKLFFVRLALIASASSADCLPMLSDAASMPTSLSIQPALQLNSTMTWLLEPIKNTIGLFAVFASFSIQGISAESHKSRS